MLNDTIQIIIMLVFIIFIKKIAITIYGLRKTINSYIDVAEAENGRIVITLIKSKKEKSYELKYVRMKNNIEEIKKYFDIVLKDKKYILREIESNNFFDFKKKAMIYIRNAEPIFDRLSITFLPDTKLKNIITEMVQLDIVEIEKNDFKTLTEKLFYRKIFKDLYKSKQ